MDKLIYDSTLDEKSQQMSKDSSLVHSSKSTSNNTEEFYSPNTSLDDKNEPTNKIDEKLVNDQSADKIELDIRTNIKIDSFKENDKSITQSPRARRSYKSKCD